MLGTDPFKELLYRVRAGDEEAAKELIQAYEPAIRRVARIRLRNPRLRQLVESMDICQSVLGSFFVRAGLGQYTLDTPEQLLKLLTAMVRHKVSDQQRHQKAQRRDQGRVQRIGEAESHLAASDPSPSQEASFRELLHKCRESLTEDERRLADVRGQGREWAEIAAQFGGTPGSLRKKLDRAIQRVVQELGLEPSRAE